MDEARRSASSRKAYRSHVTSLLKKVEELTGNGTLTTVEEPHLTTLVTTVEQLESKRTTLAELDAKIADSITEPDELETEIFKAVEIQDTISEYTHLAKRVIDRSEHQPQVPTAAPLNVNAPPYQPPSVNTTGTAKETQVTNTSTTLTHSDTENTDTLENTDSLENTQQSGVTDREVTTPLVNVTPNSPHVCPN